MQALRVWELAFRSAVEKIGYVRVLLSLGKSIVFDFIGRKNTRQSVPGQFRWKRDRQRIRFIVNREANEVSMRPVRRRKIIEARHRQRAGNLAGTIGSEVEEDY